MGLRDSYDDETRCGGTPDDYPDLLPVKILSDEDLAAIERNVEDYGDTESGEVGLLLAYSRHLKAEIGVPPAGSHPDEAKPRAATWHDERANWLAEVEQLRAELARVRAKF